MSITLRAADRLINKRLKVSEGVTIKNDTYDFSLSYKFFDELVRMLPKTYALYKKANKNAHALLSGKEGPGPIDRKVAKIMSNEIDDNRLDILNWMIDGEQDDDAKREKAMKSIEKLLAILQSKAAEQS
jgi:hypothetical protein